MQQAKKVLWKLHQCVQKRKHGFVGNPWLNSEYEKKKHVGERGSLPSSTCPKNLCSKRYELFTYYLLLITYYFKTRINGLPEANPI
ncbi:MAG: hypothetical protein F6K41_25215 [Symploca sp. SIO3E6]|nr:hypothetical protein [Caldora sp. SIO3E6]